MMARTTPGWIVTLTFAWLAATPAPAQAALDLRIAEAKDDSVQIALRHSGAQPDCGPVDGQWFGSKLNIRKVSDAIYVQPLNSEVSDESVYLKAARMGGGIYMHLPYFAPLGKCKEVSFEVSARHILWDGKWYAGSVRITSAAARDKSVFFTNEAAPVIKGASYFDAAMAAPTLARLELDFGRIISFYENVLEADPMRGVGVVAAIVRNEGNYSGFGGDALNVIRMSYDNPTPAHMATFGQVFPSTFAHELAHKLQSEKLFERPLARHIVEGSADFMKVLVLHGAGVIDEGAAKRVVLKAAADCTKFADARTLLEKAEQRSMQFREPYDCGMVYYFVAFYSSGLSGADFVATLRKAMSGAPGQPDGLCLLYEVTCRNARLNGVAGNKEQYLQQVAWLEGQLASRPMPLLKQPPGVSRAQAGERIK